LIKFGHHFRDVDSKKCTSTEIDVAVQFLSEDQFKLQLHGFLKRENMNTSFYLEQLDINQGQNL